MRTVTVCTLTVAIMLTGCAVTHAPETEAGMLELVSLTPLPPVRTSAHLAGVNMNLLLHVSKDGSVEYAKLLGSTGDEEWDSLALASIRQWKFAPPLREGIPSDVWARQLVVVQIQEPVIMTIIELMFRTRQEADSALALLEGGIDPEKVFTGPSTTVDITTYPARVREALWDLNVGEWTQPVFAGDGYRIFRRLPRGAGDRNPSGM